MGAEIKEIIRNSDLFWNLTDEQAGKLADIASEETVPAGQRIFIEGEPLRNFYIITKGKVCLEMGIRIGSRTRRRVVIDVLGSGSCLGWSIMINQPASMTGTALEPSQLVVLDGEQVRRICSEDTGLGYKVMHEIIRLVSNRLAMTRRTLAHVLSVTSHDLRAPLATVQSSIDVVVGGFAGDVNQKQKDLLLGGKQRISDLLKMIDNILDISYIEMKAVDFHRISLYQVLEASMGDVAGPAQRKAIALKNNASKHLAPVLGAEKRLQQVLTNLLSNGIKFTPNGGSVTITSHETPDKVQIDVSDTGVGVPPEDQPKLFSDFFRGGRVEAEGAGLGLSISKKILEGHGGTIWVQSPDPETNIGTRFSFTLPKVLEAPAVHKEAGKRIVTGADILVVDDDPEMRQITSLVLESQGYRVRTAQDGEDALVKIDEKEPDLLVLDLLMPKLDGFEVCKRIEEKKGKGGRKFPIIILSAVREDSSRRRYELETESELEVDDYVTKPISPPVLLQRVEKALQKQRAAGATSFTITKGGK
ncbi:MAG: ATP-binding protein [Dehalococcoidia bacterium]|nr:ATP-binding protein [Dehalococcoidia bacterium]